MTPGSARELRGLWSSVCIRCMELRQWGLPPSPVFPNKEDPTLAFFGPVVARNIGRARRRWLSAPIPPISDTHGATRYEKWHGAPAPIGR